MSNIALLIAAIIQVESGGDWTLPPNHRGAAGGMQVKMIQVHELARLTKLAGWEVPYRSKDRYDKQRTIAAAALYFAHYSDAWWRWYGRPPTNREMSAWWRVGYAASQNPTAKEARWMRDYWRKVGKAMEGGSGPKTL